jgi:hypothetical protein
MLVPIFELYVNIFAHNDLHHQRPTQSCRVSAATLLAVW